MRSWRLGAGSTWLDGRTIAGGSPYAVLRLSDRGARAVQGVLGAAELTALPRDEQQLVHRLRRKGILFPPGDPAAPIASATVIVPARASVTAVQSVLDTLPLDVPAVVVDDASPVALAGALRRSGPLRVLRHDVARGPGAARNAGAAEIRTEWLVFVDADVVGPDGWIAALLAYADDSVVALAPRVRASSARGLAGWFETGAPALDLGPVPAAVGPSRPVSYVPSAALAVRRSTFTDAGGFEETLRVGEDVDLVWRLAERGEVRFCPDVEVTHRSRETLPAAVRRRVDYGRSAAALAARHPGALHHLDVSVWSLLPWLVAVLGRPRTALALAAALSWSAPRVLPRLNPAHARRLAARGQLVALGALGRWLVRPMLPVTAILAAASPTARRRLAVAVGPALVVHWRRSKRLSAVPARLLDDAAYGVGVWLGAMASGQLEPLMPTVRFGRSR